MERILIVDDDKDLRFTVSNILKDEGFKVTTAGSAGGAFKAIKNFAPHLVLLDIKLPGMDGIRILEEIKKVDKDLIVIMITGYGGIEEAVTSMKLGAFDYITKPFDNRELVFRIQKALQTRNLSREIDSLKKMLKEKLIEEELFGKSPQIKRVLNQVKKVAPTELTVIIQGQSGTGKELIANLIHQKCKRAQKPFVAIDCGAIPVELAESELFGHEKGAFTGSNASKEGRFEQADGGTLFLDEITNLPDTIQMKLLRVIQVKKLQHIGGKKDIKIDVRIIIASNIDLYEAVKKGVFRKDLFYRLNEFRILLPSLKERSEDIPIMANYFLKEANNELNKKIKGFSPEAMKFMLNYHWPGNVRELRNLVRKGVLLTNSEYINSLDLSPEEIKAEETMDFNSYLFKGVSYKEIIEKFERDLIKRTLEKANNNKTRAAKILKMHRKALYRKMKSLNL